MKTVEYMDKKRCTGCGSCAAACPDGCIVMKTDEEGFFNPFVDNSKCRGCLKCAEACPVINLPGVSETQVAPEVYAAWSLDEEVRYDSTSGGVFTELSKAVIRQGGYVAGAKYNERHLVEHVMINRMEDIPLLRQSKYIQSETKDIFRKAEKIIQGGKTLLFVGTPCQCAGMKAFLKWPYEGLILCDFICRGVNSPKVYSKYLEELELRYGSRAKQVWFKNKTYGWNKFGTKIIFEDGQEYFGGRDTDPFMYGYIKKNLNLYMRSSCGNCEFKGLRRPVDITLGDFWGVKLQEGRGSTEGGVSMVMLHSEKGKREFNKIKPYLYFEKHEPEDVSLNNACLLNNAEQSTRRRLFWKSIDNKRFTNIMESLIMEEEEWKVLQTF